MSNTRPSIRLREEVSDEHRICPVEELSLCVSSALLLIAVIGASAYAVFKDSLLKK